jgi:tetratricopeptide (TPR) repeat protein
MGVCHARLNQLHDAERLFNEVIRLDSTHLRSYLNCGAIAERYRRLSDAGYYWRKAVELAPKWADPRNRLGLVYYRQEKYDQAIEELKQAVALDDSNADSWNNLGLAYQGKRDYRQALKCFQKAHDLDRHNWIILNNLGDLYLVIFNSGDNKLHYLNMAQLHWRKSLHENPHQPRLRDLLEYFRNVNVEKMPADQIKPPAGPANPTPTPPRSDPGEVISPG